MNSAIFGLLLVQSFCTSSVAAIEGKNVLPMSISDYTGNSAGKELDGTGIKNFDISRKEGSLLLDLVRNGALQLQAEDIDQREVKDIKRDKVYTHLIQNGGIRTDFTKPSIGFMLQVFENLLDGEDLDTAVGHTDGRTRNAILYSDTVRSFTAKRYKEEHVIFSIPSLPKHEHITMAEVRIHSNKNTNRRQRFVLLVRREKTTLEKVSLKATKRNSFIYIPEKIITRMNRFHGNISIVLREKTKKGKSTVKGNTPILVIYSSDNGFMKSVYKSYTSTENSNGNHDNNDTTMRSRRSTRNDQQKKKGRRRKNKWSNREAEPCKMHDFKVDFDLIGWGQWIIHPKTFNARVCYGQCPSPIGHEFTPTNHAMLQTLMKMKRPSSAPEPCCVPTKLRPLSMLYFEYDDIVVRHHEDMIVSECGCR
ncbi:derriere protein-like [Mercenaria mercenaria]|uniref:derriere protein-like n=1 Tax=Mercenaria mercenaria TaxID=6596 RepID=UPI00234F3168|nr:derriere protein-like [Mercenaria mercenaria]